MDTTEKVDLIYKAIVLLMLVYIALNLWTFDKKQDVSISIIEKIYDEGITVNIE